MTGLPQPPWSPRLGPPVDADDLDLTRVGEALGMVLRAPLRNLRLFVAVLSGSLALTGLAAAYLPRTFQVDTRIAAQRNLVMPSLGNPRRTVPNETDAPTRGAVDMILAHDDIVGLVKETSLVDRWESRRPAVLRLKDSLVKLISAPVSDEDRQRALVGLLERRLWVQADDSSIQISVRWDDPETAYEIVSGAQRNFLERRSARETSVIVDAIAILDGVAAKVRETLAAALSHATEVAAKVAASHPHDVRATTVAWVPPTPSVAAAAVAPDRSAQRASEADSLTRKLEDKRAQIRAVQEPWQRNLGDLRAKLADTRQTLGDAHPSVIVLQAQIASSSVEPPRLAELRTEESALLAHLEALPPVASAPLPSPVAHPSVARRETAVVPQEEPPELVEARSALRTVLGKYEEVQDRIDAARMELATAQSAFKYRYQVVLPPEVPRRPVRPSMPLVWGGGSVLAVLLAFASAIVRDLVGGRFVDRVQVLRRLKVPLLAEVNDP